MGFFNFVEQNHRIRFPADFFSQLTTFFMSHVSRRGTDQTGNGMAFHVFGHIDPDHGAFISEHDFRKGFAQFSFTNARWTEEQEGTCRTPGIFQTDAPAPDCSCNRFDRFILSDNPFMQGVFHMEQAFTFIFGHALYRDSRPSGHNRRYILCINRTVLTVLFTASVLFQFHLFTVIFFNVAQFCGGLEILTGNGGVFIT